MKVKKIKESIKKIERKHEKEIDKLVIELDKKAKNETNQKKQDKIYRESDMWNNRYHYRREKRFIKKQRKLNPLFFNKDKKTLKPSKTFDK